MALNLKATNQSFTLHEWQAGILVFVAFLAASYLSVSVFPSPSVLFLGSGIALAMLFLFGSRLWPFVFFASLTVQLLRESPPIYVLLIPLAHTLQAMIGAWALRTGDVDPLFRRIKDMGGFLTIALITATITPTLGTLAYTLNSFLGGTPRVLIPWTDWYIATVFSLFICAPFLIRWMAKPRFTRTPGETFEIIAALSVLAIIDYLLFFTEHNAINGVSLVYILLLPLFWVALRLRPRFITFALVMTSIFAISSLVFGINVPKPELFSTRLFQTELFLSILGVIFYIIVSLEEERRVTTNLLRSQLSALEDAIEKAESESTAKNDFIAVLGHELRNPLAPIANAIEYFKTQPPRAQEEATMVTLMEDRMKTVQRLLDDLLDVSRISKRKVTLDKEFVKIGTIVSRATTSTAHQFNERNQKLSIRQPTTPLWIHADPVRIEQVLSNLLTNASRYSPDSTEIVMKVLKEGLSATISVVDKGMGIEEDMLESIFEAFRQVGTEGAHKSLGIGLSLVKSFVEMHGGSVTAESAGKNKGSTFTVTLPLSREPADTAATSAHLPSKNAEVPSGPNILVVDDNDAAAWGVGKLLELRGCDVSYAYTGKQAIEKALEEKFDVILLDLGLPDQDGHLTGKTIRNNGFSGVLVALTGYNPKKNWEEEYGAVFQHYLIKPVGFIELKRVVPGLR